MAETEQDIEDRLLRTLVENIAAQTRDVTMAGFALVTWTTDSQAAVSVASSPIGPFTQSDIPDLVNRAMQHAFANYVDLNTIPMAGRC